MLSLPHDKDFKWLRCLTLSILDSRQQVCQSLGNPRLPNSFFKPLLLLNDRPWNPITASKQRPQMTLKVSLLDLVRTRNHDELSRRSDNEENENCNQQQSHSGQYPKQLFRLALNQGSHCVRILPGKRLMFLR